MNKPNYIEKFLAKDKHKPVDSKHPWKVALTEKHSVMNKSMLREYSKIKNKGL